MLIVDIKKNIPLDISKLDWNKDNIRKVREEVATIPMNAPAFKEVAEFFAYEIAAQHAWTWPDLTKITTELMVDCTFSYIRYALVVGTKPSEQRDTEDSKAWAEFEAERRQAIAENAGKTVYCIFPVMLNTSEEIEMRNKLYQVLGIY